MLTLLLLSGFVVAVLAILGFTPALEKWATAVPEPSNPDGDAELEGVARLASGGTRASLTGR
jgi:hypothetical protein